MSEEYREKEQLDLNEEQKIKLKELVNNLKKLGVDKVSWGFSGSGDSGDIDSPYVEPAHLEKSAKGYLDDLDNDISEILNQCGWDWWNNSGGHGTLLIDIKTGLVDLDMNINIEHSEEHPMQAQL